MRAQVRLLQAAAEQSLHGGAEVCATVETSGEPCADCGGRMLVQKTVIRRVVTLAHGPFRAHEWVRVCAEGCASSSGARLSRRSEELQRLVPPGAVYGYDIEVRVGLARFVHNRQREEIRAQLRRDGIELSTGEISALALRFVLHLAALHSACAERIRAALASDGGYPLHVDATGEDGRGTLFVAYAGWRHWVLGAWKLPTENTEAILPCLRAVVRDFGVPLAIVRDLGRAMIPAVDLLRQGLSAPVSVLACHLHFLRDVGTDLLKPDYQRLRGLFRDLGVRPRLGALVRDLGRRLGPEVPDLRIEVRRWFEQQAPLPAGRAGLAVVRALAQWVLDYGNDGRHRGFPFDRPYLDFYHRCLQVGLASARLRPQARLDRQLAAALDRLHQTLSPVRAEVAFGQLARRLETRCRLFERLRAVLRLDRLPSPADSRDYDTAPAETPAELDHMERSLDDLSAALRARQATPRLGRDERQALELILRHLDRHGDTLWGHVLPGPEGQAPRIVARTNNALEGHFHAVKHGQRRRSGRKILTQDLEGLPPEAEFASNLSRPDYVALVCGTIEQLPAKFSELDALQRQTTPVPSGATAPPERSDTVTAALPLADRRLVRAAKFHEHLAAIAHR